MTVANVNVRQILLKRGTTVRSLAYTGPAGEVTIDTDLRTLRIHDGLTPGGTIINTGGSGSTNQLVNGDYTVSLGVDGYLNLPNGLDGAGALLQSTSPIRINSNGNFWKFGTDGKLKLPAGGDIVDSNGTSVLGGGVSTGNFTFNADTVTNANGMVMATGRGTLAMGTNMEVPGVAQHFHIAFDGSNSSPSANDLFLGDDHNYVKLPGYELNPYAQYGVEIRAHNRNGGAFHNWRFGTDGTTIFPDNTINAGNNSLAIEAGNGISTIYANDNGSIALQGYNPNFDPTDNNIQLYEAVISVGEAFGFNELLGTNYTGPTLSVGSVKDANGNNSSEMLGLWTVDKDGNLITVKATLSGDYGDNVEVSTGDIRDREGNSLIYVPASDTAPAHKMDGLLWYNSDEGRMYIKYMGAWVDASPTVIPPPNFTPTFETVTFSDDTAQTTAWLGTYSYNDLIDKPGDPTVIDGGNAYSALEPV